MSHAPATSPLLAVQSLAVRVGRERFPAVNEVSFSLGEGERIALLGPSGCGKTSSLRAIAGFERCEHGSISLTGRILSSPKLHLPPHRRGIGLVFQDFALFPHLTVEENVAFGLTAVSSSERARVLDETLTLVELSALRHRMPGALSGGQQQRVALARALAPRPRLLLLDEPFSSLDAGLRVATRLHTERVLESVGAAAVLVTHDPAEAMAFARRLLMMRAGRVEQEGPPELLYRSPRNAFVAGALGPASFVDGEAKGLQASTLLGDVPLQAHAQGRVLLCLRPEDVTLSEALRDVPRATVTHREFRGASSLYSLETGGQIFQALAPGNAPWKPGEVVTPVVSAALAVMQPDGPPRAGTSRL